MALSEDNVMTALRVAGMSPKQIDALTFTRWKDGIDIQVPTLELLAFVALIGRLRGEGGHAE